MKKELFGTLPSGEKVHIYTVKSSEAEVKVLDFGAIIAEYTVCGRDIVGGYDTLGAYIADDSHQGGIIGRVANRIEDASFTMDGKEYQLPRNDGDNCLHGGCGFDRRMWYVTEHCEESITLSYTSADGEEGFPASVNAEVKYTVSGSALIIDYRAVPDGRTPISMTNHSYFNLEGLGGDVLSHKVRIYADEYTAVNERLIPTGRVSVAGTPYDLRSLKEIGAEGVCYDNNYILRRDVRREYLGKELSLAAEVMGGGLTMSVYTDCPCIQLYIGNFLGSGPDFKGGIKQIRHGALCLEAQIEPNSVRHGQGYYGKGEVYRQTTVYEVKA